VKVGWLFDPTRRWRTVAVIVGFVLRLVWARTATTTPLSPFSDSGNYLRMAGELADLHTPTFGGLPTALYPSGYPATLVPLVWLSRTGVISLPMAASLLNVVAGSATIATVGLVARRWLGAAAATSSAWLVALSPGLIFFTSAAVTETVFICFLLLALVVLGRIVDGDRRASQFALAGLLVGYVVLLRTPGVVVLLAPLFMIRARDHRWKGAGRATLAVFLGAAVLLVPWTIRNGVQVGAWTPGSTNNAVVMCMGNWDGADGVNTETPEQYEQCYHESPWDNPALPYAPGEVPSSFHLGAPNEGKWYRDKTSGAVRWAVTHPVQEGRLVFWKTFESMGSESTALPISRNFQEVGKWPTPFIAEVLGVAANAWLWMVLALAALGLALLRRCRAAVPIWGMVLGVMILVWGGVAQPHYKLPTVPFLAILAGGAIGALAERARAARDDDPVEHADAGHDNIAPEVIEQEVAR
jgi:4-amino-4-deoxy-L-arabinose transferase-like glycosyltransferase